MNLAYKNTKQLSKTIHNQHLASEISNITYIDSKPYIPWQINMLLSHIFNV